MPTIAASVILDRAETILQDSGNVRWSEAELLDWLNAGQSEAAVLKPNCSTATVVVALVAGTKQAIPATGFQLIDVTRNMGTDGQTPGRVITVADREFYDVLDPDWHTATGNATVQSYMYDARNPRTFYVYPPQPATGQGRIEVVVAVAPAVLTSKADIIGLDDVYANALLDYVLYRAISKDTDYASNAERAAALYSAFQAAFGVRAKNETAQDPNVVSSIGPFSSVTGGSQ